MATTGQPSEVAPCFRPGPYAWAAFGRLLLALGACGLLLHGWLLYGGSGVVVCVWWDALSGWLGRRRVWEKRDSDVQVEGFADFACFILAPALLVAMAPHSSLAGQALLPVFIVAGAWRLARFNVEGVSDKGYTGLPVTYCGYAVPAAVAIAQQWPVIPDAAWYAIVLGALSALMVTRRFSTPEL